MTITCDGCGVPARCYALCRLPGEDEPTDKAYLCDECCAHGGGDGQCYSIVSRRPMDEVDICGRCGYEVEHLNDRGMCNGCEMAEIVA